MIEADGRCGDQCDTTTLEQFACTFVDASYNESICVVDGTVLSATIFIVASLCATKVRLKNRE